MVVQKVMFVELESHRRPLNEGGGEREKVGRGTGQTHWFLASAKLLHLSHKLWQILKQCAHQPGISFPGWSSWPHPRGMDTLMPCLGTVVHIQNRSHIPWPLHCHIFPDHCTVTFPDHCTVTFPDHCTVTFPDHCTVTFPDHCTVTFPDHCTVTFPDHCAVTFPGRITCLHQPISCTCIGYISAQWDV